ncbi:unnamed protein product, partial [Adineta ricciae]
LPNQTDEQTTANNKIKKENDSQLRMKSLKLFIQTLMNDSSSLGSTYDEQVKKLETTCMKEFRDLSHERIRRMIRSVFKGQKSPQNHPTTTSHSNETNPKKNRSNSTSTITTTKTSDLVTPSTSALSALDADFLRHAFSSQFCPSIDLSAYFSAAASTPNSNGTSSPSSLFRPNFSPSNFLQSLTAPPPPLVPSHPHMNGTTESSTSITKSSKQMKLSNTETSSIKVLVNAYREAASYLNRSADELEQLI